MTGAGLLLRRHVDYVAECLWEDNTPETFLRGLRPAGSDSPDEMQPLVRIEDLSWPLASYGLEFEELDRAFSDGSPDSTSLVEDFLRHWNSIRDNRPTFAAFRDSVLADADSDDWQHLLRDRLGLAHFQPNSGEPIPVAQMVYSVRDVASAAPTDAAPFTTPTVLDSKPWEYFFPAPEGVPYGRAMALRTDGDEEDLQAEVLHTRIDYRREHLERLGRIERRWNLVEIKELRNYHLLRIQLASGRHDFGEEMP